MKRTAPAHDWLARIRNLSPGKILIQHIPMTPRYGRAAQKLGYLLRQGLMLGQRVPDEPTADAVEIAIWAPSLHGRGSGYYACFRIFVEHGEPSTAVLYCFYDGTDKSPGFRSMDSAKVYAKAQSFETNDEQDD